MENTRPREMSNHAYIVQASHTATEHMYMRAYELKCKREWKTILWNDNMDLRFMGLVRARHQSDRSLHREMKEEFKRNRSFDAFILQWEYLFFLEGNAIANICISCALRTHSNGCYEMHAHERVACALCDVNVYRQNSCPAIVSSIVVEFVIYWIYRAMRISIAYAQFLVHATFIYWAIN